MDYFESIIKTLLEHEGYWVRQSFRVNLTKEEKRYVGKPSLPRPEIDILAFKPTSREVLALEAKSFLDSRGVNIADLTVQHDEPQGRYKLFTCNKYREAILARLRNDLEEAGLVESETEIRMGLVAGKIYQRKSEEVRSFMAARGWFFWSPEDVKTRVLSLAAQGYGNDPSVITAKIIRK